MASHATPLARRALPVAREVYLPDEIHPAVLRAEIDMLRAEMQRHDTRHAHEVAALVRQLQENHNSQNGRLLKLAERVDGHNETLIDLVGKDGKGRVGHLESQTRRLWESIGSLKTKYFRLALIISASTGAGIGLGQLIQLLP